MIKNYAANVDGLVYQVNAKPFVYDTKYVGGYEAHGILNQLMSNLRLGFVIGSLGYVPNSILDVGYGNGAFLTECIKLIPGCYGFDISGAPIPQGATFIEDWKTHEVDVMTFFDSLEHFEDPYFISALPTNNIIISLPNCHSPENDVWFENWKHRKPDEHRWFFNFENIKNFADRAGFDVVTTCNIEDTIRKSVDESPNILTAYLTRF